MLTSHIASRAHRIDATYAAPSAMLSRVLPPRRRHSPPAGAATPQGRQPASAPTTPVSRIEMGRQHANSNDQTSGPPQEQTREGWRPPMLLPAAEEQKTANTAAWLPPQTNEDPLLKQPEDDVEEELSTASNSKAQDPVECTTHLRDRVRTHRQQAMMWFVLFVNMVVLIVVSVLMIVAIKKVQFAYDEIVRHDTQGPDSALMYLSMSLTSAESSLRGFLITGRESSLNRYNAALPQVDEYRHEVIQRFKDDPDPAMNETMFSELLNARLLMMRVSIAIRRSPDFHIEEWQHNNFNNESDLLMDRLHHMIFTLVTHIKQRTREDLRHTQREFGGLWIYLGIGFACVFVTIVLTLISSGRSNLKALQRQNKKLQASLQKAEEATKMKASFLANISHEIRTPMNGIVAMSQLLRATELNDEQVECVDTIIESSDVMLTLLNDLLLCCKIDAGKFLLRPEPCRLAKILKHCHHMMTARLRHRAQQGQEQSTLEFQMDVDPNIPPCILADSDRLKQVLVNLLDNAFKFSAHGRIDLIVKMVDSRLTIEQDAEKKPPSGQPPKTASSAAASAGECKELPREQRQFVEMVQSSPEYAKTNGDDVVVSIHHAVERDPTPPSTHSVTIQFTVKDTGIGIPHDMQEKIFEAFSQADMSTTKRYGGTGLGLTVSLQLVRQMGGQLTVTSEPGRGSSFSFTLTFPVVDPEAAGTQFSSSASEDESTLNTQSSPPMIAAASLALREIVTMPLESGTLEDQHDVKYSLQTPRTLPCIPSSAGSDPAGTDAAVIFHSEIPAQMVDSQLTSETVSSLYDTISRRYSVSSSSLGSCMAGMSLSAMPRGVSDSHRQTTVSTPSSRAAESDGPMLHWKESTPQSQQRVLMLRGGRLPEADPAISTGLRTQSCPLSFAPSWTGRTVDSPLLLPPAAAPFAITPAIEPLSPTALSSAAVDSLSCSATVDSHPATTSTSQQPSERICLLPPVEPFAPVLDRSRVTGSLLALRPKPIDICFVSAEAEPTLFDVPPQSSLLLHRESPAHPPSMRIDVQLAGAERSSRLATRYSHVSATLNAHRPCLHIASGAVIPPPTVEPNPEEHPLMLPRAQSLPKLTPASMIVKAAPSPMCPPAALLSASPLPSPPTAESPSTLALMCPEHCSEQARLHRIEHARSLHILCAEDNLTNQKVLRKILTREGHTIVMADNGQIAVSIFEQSAAQFDCVLLDMCMPVMDGIEACKHMRALESRWKNDAPTGPSLPDAAPTPSLLPPAAHHPTRAVTEPSLVRLARIPIIAVTASSLLEDKVTCVEAGMDDVICKPLSPKALARVLRSIVSLFHPAPTSAGSSSRRLQERPSTPATSTFTSAVHPLGSPSVDICHA